MKKRNKGITLIALIITIIILIILAGISIATLTGDNGLLTKASGAKEESEIGREKEIVKLVTNEVLVKEEYGIVTLEKLQDAFNTSYKSENVEIIKSNKHFEVLFLDTKRYYEVSSNGEVGDYITAVEDNYPGDITRDIKGNNLGGSENNPYEINCIEDLVAFSNIVNGEGIKFEDGELKKITSSDSLSGKYIRINRNLNFKSRFSYVDSNRTDFEDINGNNEDGNILFNEVTTLNGFVPIGISKNFSGVFDGNYFEINEIYINRDENAGLFGYVNNATIRNLQVSGEITSCKNTAGGIVARVKNSNIENCTNYINVNSVNDTPSYGYDSGIIYGDSYVGGIAGGTSDSVIDNCKNYGKIYSKVADAGGITGNCGSIVKNCKNYGEIYGGHIGAGISTYEYCLTANIYNCTNYGDISSDGIAGGIWGYDNSGTVNIYNSNNVGLVTSEGNAGGICGGSHPGTSKNIKNCSNIGKIVGGSNATGGIVGMLWGSNITITNSYYINNIEKSIGNSNSTWATKFNKEEFDSIKEKLNNYIDSNTDTTNEWLYWEVSKDGLDLKY